MQQYVTGNSDIPQPILDIDEKIAACQKELEILNNKRNFPYVYILVAIPTTILFMLLTYISRGLLSFTTGITGSLFFSLLITSTYVVLYQPTREELIRDLVRQIKKLNRDKARLEAGIRGERDVRYALSWLPEEYIIMNDIALTVKGLENQQIDHLVIGPNGIFHLETKNINGALIITPNGEWSILRASQNRVLRENIASPYQQVERHEAVIKKILENCFNDGSIPLVSAIVLAHPQSIIEGEDPRLYVVKKDRVTEFIKHYKGMVLTPEKVKEISIALVQAVLE